MKNSRQARRMMERMGLKMEEVPNVSQVVIKMATKEIIIESPSVTLMHVQGQDTYQIVGGKISETGTTSQEMAVPEEDVLMVAQQANVNPETARKALKETKGDLAQAIILLAQRRMG